MRWDKDLTLLALFDAGGSQVVNDLSYDHKMELGREVGFLFFPLGPTFDATEAPAVFHG